MTPDGDLLTAKAMPGQSSSKPIANPHLRPMSQAILAAFEEDPEPNRFGMIQAFTRAAQRFTPERRLMLEEFAGEVAAQRHPEAAS